MNLLFDLDGTLADPFEAFSSSIHHAFAEHHLRCPDMKELQKCIGPPLHLSLKNILGKNSSPKLEAVLSSYRKHHADIGIFQYRFYPEASQCLENLNEHHQLFVATSKPTVFVLPLLRHFKKDHYFKNIYGSEISGVRSDKGELLQYLIHREDLNPKHTIMIGDREHDIIGAKKTKIHSIGVTWGYGSLSELNNAGADRVCTSWEDLLKTCTWVANENKIRTSQNRKTRYL